METPNDHDVLRRLIQKELAKVRDTQHAGRTNTYRIHKSHSRKHYHRSRRYSDSSTDSEAGDRPMVSFLHHQEGEQPFYDLASPFPTVVMKYFKQIFYGSFQPENLTKLGQGMADRAALEAPQEAKGMAHLLLCMEVYGQIVLHFSARNLLGPLQQAFSQYRTRLIEMSVIYKFDSIRAYNATFMRTRILLGQDDPVHWALEDRRCCDLLVRKMGPTEASKAPASGTSKSFPSGHNVCRNFNEGKCTRDQCKYSHTCLNCQQNHPANTCHKASTAVSASNLTPLGNRVSRPE